MMARSGIVSEFCLRAATVLLGMNRQESDELFEEVDFREMSSFYTEIDLTPGESFRQRDHQIKKEGIVEIIISSVAGVVVGAFATKLVTGVASSAGTVAWAAAKEVVKGGLIVQEAVSDMCSGGGELFQRPRCGSQS